MIPIALLLFIGVPIVAFLHYRPRVLNRSISTPSALWRFALIGLLPALSYIGLFFAMIGLEEATGAGYISEEMARTFLLMVGIALLVWLAACTVFVAMVVLSRSARQRNS